MKTQIFFHLENQPNQLFNMEITFGAEQTKTYFKTGTHEMMQIWCERVLKMQFPKQNSTLTKIVYL